MILALNDCRPSPVPPSPVHVPPPPVAPTPIVMDPVVVANFVRQLAKDTAGLTTFGEKLARVLSIDPAAYTEEEIVQVSMRRCLCCTDLHFLSVCGLETSGRWLERCRRPVVMCPLSADAGASRVRNSVDG